MVEIRLENDSKAKKIINTKRIIAFVSIYRIYVCGLTMYLALLPLFRDAAHFFPAVGFINRFAQGTDW